MSAGVDDKEKDPGLAESGALTLLPPQVTSSALPFYGPDALRPSAPSSVFGSSELSDGALVAAIRRGDERVGKLLYSRLVHIIDATVARVLGPGQPDHDDWVQVVFEEVLRTIYRGQFQGRCRLTSWAASIACNVCLNAIRRRKTERGLFAPALETDELRPADASSPERALEARAELRRLREALASLTPGRAEAVVLHDALGYDLSEVAALTGSTEAAVQSRLSRGRRDLQERLGLDRKGDK